MAAVRHVDVCVDCLNTSGALDLKSQTRVLLIEDSAVYARLIEDCLRPEGLELQWVKTADEALAVVAADPPEIILCDIVLPGERDGFALCREIKQQHPGLQFLMISSLDSTFDKITGLETGADDYLTKPFEPIELRARFRVLKRRLQQLQTGPSQVQKPLQARGLAVNPATREASFQRDLLDLRRREFDLLYYLMAHADQVVQREALLEAIWEQPEVTQRTIDTHVQRLRDKLQQAGAPLDLIETHRGTGYRFKAKL